MNITKHAKERYAERIMDKNDKSSIAVFIAQHEEKIKTDIEKMVQYADLIYEGESLKNPKDTLKIYLNGLWVIILDANTSNVITLYSVDLGVDEELNNLFVSKMKARINSSTQHYSEVEEELKNKHLGYKDNIRNNEIKIANYKKIIKSLEDNNYALKDLMDSENALLKEAKTDIQEAVMTLIGKKTF